MDQPVEVEVAEDVPIVARVAGIDVAKGSGMVCTRVPDDSSPNRRVTKLWKVAATAGALAELADHLVCQGIERVVLESTSDYWRPFLYVLQARGLTVWLVNAAQVKNVPGRPKSDKEDAVWLALLAERSMLSPSFVPAEPMRHVRDLARARFDLVEDRTRVKQRLEKLLEDALIKISSVLSDLHGASGRAIVDALVAGERNPRVLAGLARGRARGKHSELVEACSGRFTEHHARLARMLLDQLDELTGRIETLTRMLDEEIQALPTPSSPPTGTSSTPAAGGDASSGPTGDDPAPVPSPATVPQMYTSTVQRLCTIPGAGPDTVRSLLAEIGLDMTVFGTSARLCSWAKTVPRTVQSGKRTSRGRTGKGNRYVKSSLGLMAAAAARTDTFLGARYRRLVKRMPKAKALVALERSILVIVFHLLSNPTATFTDLGADFYERRIDRQRRTQHLTRELAALGYRVQLSPLEAA